MNEVSTIQRPAASVESPIFPELFDLVYESRVKAYEDDLFYDPWLDLGRRRGVEVDFHNPGPVAHWSNPRGLTHFGKLRITLRFSMMDVQMRCTVAHELVHLDRGPRGDHVSEAVDEARTSRLAAQRLVNPYVFDRLQEIYDGKAPNYAIHTALNVDRATYLDYRGWRARCKASTAQRAWDEARVQTPWPALWIGEAVLKEPGELPALEAVLRSPDAPSDDSETGQLIAALSNVRSLR